VTPSGSPRSNASFNPRPSCEGRLDYTFGVRYHQMVSIRAPRVRGDAARPWCGGLRRCFNPRPSCEGRLPPRVGIHLPGCFNPRPSCEGRLPRARRRHQHRRVSIRAPRVRGDPMGPQRILDPSRFNPRPSCEGRLPELPGTSRLKSFNPRPSCEGRPMGGVHPRGRGVFQSAPLV